MGFHDVRFPTDLSFGATGGPERRTEIVSLASGHEQRNSPWAHARRRYDAGVGLRSLDDLEAVIAFFEARRGPLYAFRFRDWTDWKSGPASRVPEPLDQAVGTGDGTTASFALRKTYASGGTDYVRPITHPVAGTVRVAVNGAELFAGFSVDAISGVLRFDTPPDEGADVTAGFEFDVPVRFDSDAIVTSLSKFSAGEVPSIPLVEVRV